jgi:uncharacterized integral membrane protein
VTDPPAPSPATGRATYVEFLKEEIAAQAARKASFEAKGIAVITTSGTLVTLLFALAALSTKRAQTFELPKGARDWLFLALILFFAAAVAALVTNAPMWYQSANTNEVKPLIETADTEEEALANVGLVRVAVVDSAEKWNNIKGYVLLGAMVLEVLAVGCVALAVNVIL